MVKRFTDFGGPIPQRPVQDLAFAVARFVQKGGSYVNYYMVGSLLLGYGSVLLLFIATKDVVPCFEP